MHWKIVVLPSSVLLALTMNRLIGTSAQSIAIIIKDRLKMITVTRHLRTLDPTRAVHGQEDEILQSEVHPASSLPQIFSATHPAPSSPLVVHDTSLPQMTLRLSSMLQELEPLAHTMPRQFLLSYGGPDGRTLY